MNDVSTQINNIINSLAEKLGVAAGKIYPVLIKQAYVEGATNIFWIIIVSMLTILLIKYWIRFMNLEIKKDSESIPIKWIGIIIIIIISFVFLPSIKDTITAFMNPDWYVLEMILNKISFKGAIK